MTWKLLKSTGKYKNRFMTVTEDELVTGHGDRVTFGVVHKADAVIVIPWDGVHFTLIGQYRYPVDAYSWEFPAGHFEHADVESTARAELEEEAGLIAGKLEEIGTFYVAPGHLTQICHIFLATELTPGTRALEAAEKGMEIKSVTSAEIDQMIKNGLIKDGLTLTSLKFLALRL